MADKHIKESDLIQNLKDAGCSSKVIASFMANIGQSSSDQKRILSAHRSALLDKIHKHQKKLDCLDYLIYRLNQKP